MYSVNWKKVEINNRQMFSTRRKTEDFQIK